MAHTAPHKGNLCRVEPRDSSWPPLPNCCRARCAAPEQRGVAKQINPVHSRVEQLSVCGGSLNILASLQRVSLREAGPTAHTAPFLSAAAQLVGTPWRREVGWQVPLHQD